MPKAMLTPADGCRSSVTYPEFGGISVIRYRYVDLDVVRCTSSFELRLDFDHVLDSAALMMLDLRNRLTMRSHADN